MNKLVIFAFFTLVFVKARAQDFEVTWGPSLESGSKYSDPKILGEDDNFLYAVDFINQRKVDFILERIHKKTLKRELINDLEMPGGEEFYFTYEGMDFLNGNFVLFASTYDKEQNNSLLKSFTIDAESGKYIDNQLLFENEVEKENRKGLYRMYKSEFGEMRMFHYLTYYKKQKKTKEVFLLLNGDLEKVLDKTLFHEKYSNNAAYNYLLDDEGSIYFKRKNNIVVYDANLEYEEWSQEIDLKEGELGAYLADFTFRINADNSLILTGSYYTVDGKNTDENKSYWERMEGDTQVEGMFYMEIDGISKETRLVKLSRFKTEFIDQFRTERDIKKGRAAEINEIPTRARTIYKKDGGLILVTENYSSIRYFDDKGKLDGEDFYYSDLLIFNFSTEGQLLWATRIPKNQKFYWSSWRSLPSNWCKKIFYWKSSVKGSR